MAISPFFSCRYSTRTKYMKESETDEMLLSNISYLKQFRLNKMGAEVVISDRFLISKFPLGLTHSAVEMLPCGTDGRTNKQQVKIELLSF